MRIHWHVGKEGEGRRTKSDVGESGRERESVSEREQEDGECPTVEFPSRLARVSMTTGT